MRREERDRDEQAAQAAQPRVGAHHVAVRDDVWTADLEGGAARLFQIEGGMQVGEHVRDRDWLRQRRHPSRADHHRQAFDERLDHLERQAAGADHHRGAKLDDRDAAGAKRVTGLGAALEMCREHRRVVGQTTQIDDAPNAGTCCGAAEVRSGTAIALGEIRAASHRMHQVVGGLDSGQRSIEGAFIEAIALDDLRRGGRTGESSTVSHEASHRAAVRLETDEAGVRRCSRLRR